MIIFGDGPKHLESKGLSRLKGQQDIIQDADMEEQVIDLARAAHAQMNATVDRQPSDVFAENVHLARSGSDLSIDELD
jgi:hypothetical protein